MLLSTHNFQNRKKSSVSNVLAIDALLSSNYSSRHSVASPGSQLLIPETATGVLRGRKSSVFSAFPPKEKDSQTPINLMSAIAIGKLKYKAEQTKQFLKAENNPRRNLMNLSIHDSDIAKIVLKVLMKPSDQRSGPEKNFLIKTLKNEEFFFKIKEKTEKDIFLKIFNEIRHMFYPKQKIIYHNGDLLKKALMIIEGEIWLLKPKQNKTDFYVSEHIQEKIEKHKELSKFRDYIKTNYPDFQINEILKTGSSIGIECLFNEKDQFSKSLCLAKENTHFLAVHKDTYQKLKDEHKNKILNEKLDFLKSFSMFSKWSTNNLKTLLNFCEIRVYQYSSIIFKEKELANYLYLIKNGEIEISKVVEKDIASEEEFEYDSLQDVVKQAKTLNAQSYNKMNRVWSAKENKQNKKRIFITKLCSNQFFGEKEIAEKEGTFYTTRAIVKSETAEIYAIPKHKFLELSHLLNSINSLKDFSDAKEKWRENLIQKCKFPIPSRKIEKHVVSVENNDEFQLISHVKTHKLLDKEIQTLKGRKPIRGEFEIKNFESLSPAKKIVESRPYTARESNKKTIFDLHENSNELIENFDFTLKIWSNSPKNIIKRQKELERRIKTSRTKKATEDECFSDLFFLNTKRCATSDVKEKMSKLKIYKRLKIDKIFPNQKFFSMG